MVKTTDDVMDIHPLDRMEKLQEISEEKKSGIAAKKKELEELERRKKRELDELEQKQKKEIEDLGNKKRKDLKDLESKRKELEELEKKKIKEIEETEDLIEKSFQDLMRHKRKIIAEEQEFEKAKNLEALTGGAPAVPAQPNYGRFFETLEAPKRLYDMANTGFYNNLTELRNRAAAGTITPEEERFVENLRSQFERFNENPGYIEEKDKGEYVRRSLNIIEQIGTYVAGR